MPWRWAQTRSVGRRLGRIALAVSVLGVCVAFAVFAPDASAQSAGAVAAPAVRGATRISSNWAGYAATLAHVDASGAVTGSGSFTAVAATWVQPAARCVPWLLSGSVFWVGLGGFTEQAQGLEQIGTATFCDTKGVVSHSVWYEILPEAAVEVKLKLGAGDRIRAAVSVSGRQVWFTLKNLTRGTRFSKRVTMTRAPDLSSAEWIIEAPSFCLDTCVDLALPNFGIVTVFGAAAIGDGHPGTISDPVWSPTGIELVSEYSLDLSTASRLGAVPAPLSADGRSFDVTWRSDLAAPPPEATPPEGDD